MKKKMMTGLAFLAMLATPPLTTSCSEEDLDVVIGILDLLISYDDLANTAWITEDNSFALEFLSNKQGNYYESSEALPFTYLLDLQNETLTLNFDEESYIYKIIQFTANKSLVLKNAKGRVFSMIPFTGE